MSIEFKGFPKIPRLFRDISITEKIDGTNAAIIITDEGEVGAQSRNRIITPDADNFGFATWVAEHEDSLLQLLGPGTHYGEFWGKGIQRGYGLQERRFSLFNAVRWADIEEQTDGLLRPVPVLYEGVFGAGAVDFALNWLKDGGSAAAPGFMKPEGIVVYHAAARQSFKILIENDDQPKGLAQ